MGVVALVMDVQRHRAAQDLVIALVPARDVHAHDERLVGLVGDHDALAHLGLARPVLGSVIGLLHGRGGACFGPLGLELGAVRAALTRVALAVGLALGQTLFERARPAGRLGLGGPGGGVALAAGGRVLGGGGFGGRTCLAALVTAADFVGARRGGLDLLHVLGCRI